MSGEEGLWKGGAERQGEREETVQVSWPAASSYSPPSPAYITPAGQTATGYIQRKHIQNPENFTQNIPAASKPI
ncbi:hypothetical protein AAFF_G00173960 [Aldrovandia affinis]|uniref:Uncharacterized protein n=1 Tax=Aldrovandia affinis TaxID=143900 RepID=A0AAD7WWB1_9TELE|nr:hypothetical protein AAFF_G00173960 [Aldrovandia affinis]